MSTRGSGLVLVTLLVVGGCERPAPAPTATGATQADTAAVNDLRQQELAAVGSGDTTLAYVADDIVLMPPNEPAVVGKAAARVWFAGMLGQFKATVSYTGTSTVFSGDMAVEQYSGSLTMTPVAGGAATTEVLKGLHVYRRDAGGSWKMTQDIWNTDTAPAPAPAK